MKTGCDRDCSTCDVGNRSFCAVQLSLKNQELLIEQQSTIAQQQEIIKSLVEVLTPILSPSASLTSPDVVSHPEVQDDAK